MSSVPPKVTVQVQKPRTSEAISAWPYFAESSKLKAVGAQRSKEQGPKGDIDVFELKSVMVRAFHTTIVDSNELASLASELTRMYSSDGQNALDSGAAAASQIKSSDDECVYVNGLKLKVPPMIFDNDVLSFTFNGTEGRDGVVISFRGRDALFAWVKRHDRMEILPDGSRNVVLPNNEFVKVPFSEQWNAARVKTEADSSSNETALQTYNDIKIGTINKWDWTFTSDYCLSYSFFASRKEFPFILTASNLISSRSNSGNDNNISHDSINSGGGISSDGGSSTSTTTNSSRSSSSNISDDELRAWRPTPTSGINMALLRDQAQPILFSDELILYQDDLEDSGDVTVSVRVRIMPTCVFILNRFFLRVDGSIIRMRETRVFHEFSLPKPCIHMEILWKEVSLLPATVDATVFDPVALALRAKLSSDFNLQSDQNLLSQQLPVVNSKYSVHPYYTIDL